jgi:hypothetical protein
MHLIDHLKSRMHICLVPHNACQWWSRELTSLEELCQSEVRIWGQFGYQTLLFCKVEAPTLSTSSILIIHPLPHPHCKRVNHTWVDRAGLPLTMFNVVGSGLTDQTGGIPNAGQPNFPPRPAPPKKASSHNIIHENKKPHHIFGGSVGRTNGRQPTPR